MIGRDCSLLMILLFYFCIHCWMNLRVFCVLRLLMRRILLYRWCFLGRMLCISISWMFYRLDLGSIEMLIGGFVSITKINKKNKKRKNKCEVFNYFDHLLRFNKYL
jgi:hypothetical protein